LTSAQAGSMINSACFFGAGLGAILLFKLGRRTLMIAGMLICAVGMYAMFLFTNPNIGGNNKSGEDVGSIIYIIGFQCGPGPIVWLYLSEICSDKATSVNTVVSLILNLLITASTLPIMSKNFGNNGWLFLVYGCTCTLGLVYVILKMKETKGVSEEKVKRLYRKDDQTYDTIM